MEEETLPPPTLEDLRGLRLPDEIPGTPQTVGWWILLAVGLVVLLTLALLAWRRWHRRRYRREAQAELARLGASIVDGAAPASVVREIPALVKRVALAAWPREEVAGLSDEAWLAFLDASGGGGAFRDGPGRLLPRLAYASETPDPDELRSLIGVVSTWIDKHRVRA